MADNITLNTGSGGDVVATEDIAGVEYQKVKLVDGTAASTTTIPLAGDLTNGLDVDVTRVSGTVTVDGSGVTQPVSGTVTANPASGTIDTVTTITNPVTIDNDDTVSTNNSTTTPLGISGNFTGTGDDCLGYSTVTCTLFADQNSATNGMTFEFSTDNTNWDDVYTFTLAAGTTRRFQFPVCARYFRLNYTNGTTGQGAFRVQTILHRQNQLTSIHRLEDNVDADRSATVVKSALIAQASGSGDFVPVAASATGKLQVAAETEGSETPADADATPTNAVPVQSFNAVYNGTTWDLVREGATAGSILVDGSNVTQPVSGAVTANAGTNLNTSALLTTAAHDAAFGTAGTADAQVRSVQGIAGGTAVVVDGSAVTQPVSGTVTANPASGTIDTVTTVSTVTNVAQMGGTAVNVGAGTEAGALRVTLPTDGTGVVKLGSGAASIGVLGTNSGVDIGDVDVTSISAGSNLIGDVGISGARTSGGTTLYKNIDVDESEDEIKGTGGQVYWIHAINLTASVLYLKLYNATAATVVVGTTVPDLTFPIPTQGDANGAGFTLSIPNGIAFSTAITVAATTGVADNDSGAPAANACVVNLGYA